MSVTPVIIPKKNTYGFMIRFARKGMDIEMEWVKADGPEGMAAAERKAKKREAEIAENLPPPNTSHKDVPTKKNTSGKVGIRIAVSPGRPGSDTEYYAWTAFWTDRNRKRGTASFAWTKFGEPIAKLLASIARDNETNDRSTIFRLYETQTGRTIDED